MTTYHSPRLGLVIDARPKGPRIQFTDGVYRTKNKKEQATIEGSRGFGIYIFKEEQAPETEPEIEPDRGKGKKDSEPVEEVDEEAPAEGFDLDSLLPDAEE